MSVISGLFIMKAVDKFGNPIYSRVFEKLLMIGEVLRENSWRERADKPNLFYKKFEDIFVHADMRGTEIIPIWKEPVPMLYSMKTGEDWKDRKVLRKASEELKKCGIEYRYSYYHDCEPSEKDLEEYQRNMDMFGIDGLADGKCRKCEKDFDSDGLFCSEKCESDFSQKSS